MIIFDSVEIAQAYLKNTDWYYTRKMETGEEVPTDVVANRIAAREYLNQRSAIASLVTTIV